MSNEELQIDEREALLSIYEGDEFFKELNPKVYQYRVRVFECNIFVPSFCREIIVIDVWHFKDIFKFTISY